MPVEIRCVRNALALPFAGFLRCPKDSQKPLKGFCFLLCHFPSGRAARLASSVAPIQHEGAAAETVLLRAQFRVSAAHAGANSAWPQQTASELQGV